MSAVPAYPAVPTGQYPPFATVTSEDHRAWIIIATSLGVAFTLSALVTRVLIRKYVNFGWALDDTLLATSTVVSFVQSSLVLVACSDGLGQSIQLIPLPLQARIQQLYYASNLFYLCALGISKIVVVLFLRRLMSPDSNVYRYSTVLVVLIPVSMVAFMLVNALQCDLSQPWIIFNSRCSGWFLRWEIQAAIECLFEVAIFAAPVWLVWNLQTQFEIKVEVVVLFAIRLVILVFTGLRLGSFNRAAFANNFTLHEAQYICWTQAELSYSIIAATIPTARKLAFDLVTYYNGGQFGSTLTGNSTQGETFQMSSLKSAREPASSRKVTALDGYNSHNNSREMIIRKDSTPWVHHDFGR